MKKRRTLCKPPNERNNLKFPENKKPAFPPLDGGKIFLLLIEAIRKKPLKQKTEIGIQMAGFVLLIGLSIFVTYNDIVRIL